MVEDCEVKYDEEAGRIKLTLLGDFTLEIGIAVQGSEYQSISFDLPGQISSKIKDELDRQGY